MSMGPSSRLITLMNSSASGAKSTIWRMEFTATRMAQYSLSPPARPVQIRTWGLLICVSFYEGRYCNLPSQYILLIQRG